MGSFFAVKRDYFLKFERREDGLGEGTADIIRLIGPSTILARRSPLIYSISVHLGRERVQRFMVVDNSDFSSNGLTALVTHLILASQGRSPCFPF
jgi:hypothetical protein